MTSTTQRQPAPMAVGTGRLWLEAAFVCGLAGVFLVNALVAWVEPTDFARLVERSAAGRWFDLRAGRWLGLAIGFNDLLIGIAIVASTRYARARPLVFAWAGTWLLAVTFVKLTSLDAFAS